MRVAFATLFNNFNPSYFFFRRVSSDRGLVEERGDKNVSRI
jgi:hypothetical protein